MTAIRPRVTVVDDDESVRESLPDLLNELGFASVAFSSAEAFLASEFLDQSQCLLVDVAMPGMTGPELQLELLRRGNSTPIIFITAQINESVRKSVLKRGAVACLFKPFTEATLLEAIDAALAGG